MGFRQEVRVRLGKLEHMLEQISKMLAALNNEPPEVARLVKQNRELMDRIMSQDWTKYINQAPDRWPEPQRAAESDAFDEESLIGTEVENYAGGNK